MRKAGVRIRSQTLPSKISLESLSTAASSVQDSPDLSQMSSQQPPEDPRSPVWVLTNILHLFGDKELSAADMVRRANELVVLLEGNAAMRQDLALQSILHKLERLLVHPNSVVVACGYRILRCLVDDYESLALFKKLNLQYFLIHSLAADSKKSTEREESLKLVRRFIDVEDGGVQLVDLGMVKAVVAVADNSDDPLRLAALETVCELALLSGELVFKAGGIRSIVQYILEGAGSLTPTCISTVVKMLELPQTRNYAVEEAVIESLISPFMEVMHFKAERLQNLAYVITCLLKTWPGLAAFCYNDFAAFRQLVSCLTFDSSATRMILIHIFYDILRIRPLPWVQVHEQEAVSVLMFTVSTSATPQHAPKGSSGKHDASFVNQYTSLLLRICFQCGLWDLLTDVFDQCKDKKLQRKIVYLLSEMNFLQNALVPAALRVHVAPSFELNLLLESSIKRHHRAAPTAASYEFARSQLVSSAVSKLLPCAGDGIVTLLTPDSIQLRLQNAPSAVDIKTLILNTHVLTTASYATWDWGLINQLLRAPLRNVRVFDEVVKTTKFYKRLVSFYRPFKYRFSTLRKTKANQVYVRTGCEIFRNLLSHKSGVNYLSENKLLPQIAECLAQVDPYSGIVAKDALFSRSKLENTLSSAFFRFLGILSEDPNGIRMLERWWIFDMYYHITDFRTQRDDLVRLILKHTSYQLQGHARIILRKVASTGTSACRLQSTKILGGLLSQSPCEPFAIRQLASQFCDRDSQVRELAVAMLTSHVQRRPASIDLLVACRPALDHLGRKGSPLIEAIFSRPAGFQYLQNQQNFVEAEMEVWVETKAKLYVKQVEMYLARRLFNLKGADEAPYHFFGALVRTAQGVQLLESTDTFSSFSNTIHTYSEMVRSGSEAELYETAPGEEVDSTLLELKAALWAVGHIGASEYGVALLELSDLVTDIRDIAVKSANVSLRGVCFFVLGLVSNTEEGMEILDDVGWQAVKSRLGESLCISLPTDIGEIFTVSTDKSVDRLPPESSLQTFEAIMDADYVPYNANERVVEHVPVSGTVSGVLGSSQHVGTKYSQEYLVLYEVYESLNLILVNQAKAYSTLNKNKKRYPALFSSEPALLKLIMSVLEQYRLKPPARKHLLLEVVDFNRMMEVLLKRERKPHRDSSAAKSSTSSAPFSPEPPASMVSVSRAMARGGSSSPTPVNSSKSSMIMTSPEEGGSGTMGSLNSITILPTTGPSGPPGAPGPPGRSALGIRTRRSPMLANPTFTSIRKRVNSLDSDSSDNSSIES